MLGEKIAPLSSPLLLDSKEHYEFVVPALPPARYPFVCLPHAASGMKGVLVVVP
jgi:plastocyanin